MHGAAQRPRVVEFLRVDAGGRAAGNVADIVGARATCGETEFLYGQQKIDRVLRRNLANLQVGARRHIGIAAAERIRRIGQAAHLPGVQDAVGNAQPAHEGIFGRRDEEQPVILGEEDVDALGELPGLGAAHHLVPPIQRMSRALGGFLGHQLAARRHGAVLGSVLQGIGTDRLAGRCPRRADGQLVGRLAGLNAADKTLQPLLLSVVELFSHAPPLQPEKCRRTATFSPTPREGQDQAATRAGTL